MTEGMLVATGLATPPVHYLAHWVQSGSSTRHVGLTP
jgi:hypothetical protein